ncbi:MAG: l-allo-threonine aldolase [Lasallia pustulata]|uniref:L-allo-threonine aldolase n=1 Tax=Lasallia pustulata TaxID=136370 RepID=A0A5M8PL35_9LECA|nr:MAG: l-allo-threonine aldolase [Lasallia pustulata]
MPLFRPVYRTPLLSFPPRPVPTPTFRWPQPLRPHSYGPSLPRTSSTTAPAHTMPQTAIQRANGANNWAAPGPAEFDFRSDVVTTPTTSMLTAIQNTTLLDDVFGEDPTTTALESFIADLTGHEAALLVLSGTMGNLLSLTTLLPPPPTPSSPHPLPHPPPRSRRRPPPHRRPPHPRPPATHHHLSLPDILAHAVLGDGADVHACPTRVLSLENTLGGEVTPLDECRRIADWARGRGGAVKVHCDGARLWEAAVAVSVAGAEAGDEAPSPAWVLKEYCRCFDSVSLCFSKGLGAPVGSVVVGSRAFVKRARWLRKSIGGGLRQAGVISAAARVSVEETFLGGGWRGAEEGEGGRAIMGGQGREVDEKAGVEYGVAAKCGVRASGGRLVVHYQISDEAVERLVRVMDEILGRSRGIPG